MKRLFTFLVAVGIVATVWAQSPQKMSYQAVIRDASNKLVVNRTVGMRISILQGSASGTAIYTETQKPGTNANGLVSIEIGTQPASGPIDWASGPYFIKTETDPEGGTNYTITGTSQLLSVPYALYAENGGTPGPQGLKGDKGDQGSRGIQGPAGADGLTTSVNGVTQVAGAITLTKSNIGLENVDNTSDTNKPISSPTQAALNLKVDKVTGKGLSTEDYTTVEKTKLADIIGTNTGDQDLSGLATTTSVTTGLAAKVDVVAGKGLSTNDYTAAEQTKLAGIATGAEVNVQADWNATTGGASIANKPNLATVATTGSYNDLTDKPSVDGQTAGDMVYFDGTAWVRVVAGTPGQLLSENASGIPEWKNPSSLKSAATQVPTMTASGVIFNGVVNANALPTTVMFEYGTTTSYGTSVPAMQSPVSGSVNSTLTSASITNLVIGTVYHVRLVAQNVFGTFYGDDIRFRYLYVGANYGGGLVVSLNAPGSNEVGTVCSLVDVQVGASWSDAFLSCAAFRGGGYSDWFLPDQFGLQKAMTQLPPSANFSSDWYWTSQEANSSLAYSRSTSGSIVQEKTLLCSVRAFRKI